MQTYLSKTSDTPNVGNTTASVVDNSTRNSNLQRKADLANSSLPIQRRAKEADLLDYMEAYGPEIDKTNSMVALLRLVINDPLSVGRSPFTFSPLRFTDNYNECKVGLPFGNIYPKMVQNIVVPDPKAKIDMSCPNVKNLSAKLRPSRIRRMFAIHELEHLRLFYQNTNKTLIFTNGDCGEPSSEPITKSMFVPLKKEICDCLQNAVPKDLDEKLKNYIAERLMYIKRPFSLEQGDNHPLNTTARELTTVMLELITFCEFLHDERLAQFEAIARDVYQRWK